MGTASKRFDGKLPLFGGRPVDPDRDAVVTMDLDGVIRSWSVGAEEMSGWRAGDAIGRSVMFLYPPGDEGRLVESLRLVRERGLHSVRRWFVDKSGDPHLVEARLSIVRDDDGQPEQILACARFVDRLADTALGEVTRGLVLVVEDHSLVRVALRHTLEADGHEVIEAASGPEALAVYRAHGGRVQLILMDVVLPGGLAGPHLVSELFIRGPRAPVLYMSAHPRKVLVQEGRLPDDADAIEKPFDRRQLLRRIRTHLH